MPGFLEAEKELHLGPLRISFQRVPLARESRQPLTSSSYGVAPIARSRDSSSSGPTAVVPVAEDETFWLGLETQSEDEPGALRIIVEAPEAIDAVNGAPIRDELADDSQNYVVVPPQRSLKGVKTGPSTARPFGRGSTAGSAVVPCESLRLVVFRLRPDIPAPLGSHGTGGPQHAGSNEHGRSEAHASQGGSSGDIVQRIVKDPYGKRAWAVNEPFIARIAILSPNDYSKLTGQAAPDRLDETDTYRGWCLP